MGIDVARSKKERLRVRNKGLDASDNTSEEVREMMTLKDLPGNGPKMGPSQDMTAKVDRK